jgi:Ca-activated chloride channel family protein
MNQLHKLPLVKQAMHTLVKQLRSDDRVAIVTYAGSSGLALPSTPAARSREILNALDALTPTQPEAGVTSLHLAYDVARANFVPDAINRVILCTDGDFHALSLPEDELLRFVEDRAGGGIPLTVFGFGVGNYPDTLLEKLARRGSGSYAYVDTRREAEKLLVAQLNSTLVTVAKDVKINVDFNPAKVARYRLIGYENRLLRKEDFGDDSVDAGELGAGHMVTALYEIVPVRPEDKVTVDLSRLIGSKYAPQQAVSSRLEMPDNDRGINHSELLTLTVRYKKPGALFSVPSPIEVALVDRATPFARASADFKFAAAVAQFGMILRGSPHRGGATMGDVIAWAATAASPADDPGGYRGEFIELARKAQTLLR